MESGLHSIEQRQFKIIGIYYHKLNIKQGPFNSLLCFTFDLGNPIKF